MPYALAKAKANANVYPRGAAQHAAFDIRRVKDTSGRLADATCADAPAFPGWRAVHSFDT